MKRNILTILLMTLALHLSARMYVPGEDIYVNTNQTAFNVSGSNFIWKKDGAKLFLYFFQSTAPANSEWVQLSPIWSTSDIYTAQLAGTHSWYDRVIVVRKSPTGTAGNWNDKWNQTCDIMIPDNESNYLDNFDCNASDQWKTYAPAAIYIGTSASQEVADTIHICPSALGHIIALHPKLNSDTTAYLYDQVKAHAWYQSTDGGDTWTALDTKAGSLAPRPADDGLTKTLFTTLPAAIPLVGIDYYLYSSIPAGRRLVHIVADAPKCVLDCEITAFETAISAVNADDNTYTLDGMVAFGEPNGSLVISCDGKDTIIVNPVSPQAFSLRGVPAAKQSGVKTMAYAYFMGAPDACLDSIEVDVPDATQTVQHYQVDSLTGRDIYLDAHDADPANDFVWIVVDNKTGLRTEYTPTNTPGLTQTFHIDPFLVDDSVTIIYKEYYPVTGTMSNLISNGNYEDETVDYGAYGQVSKISDYNFWGIFPQTATAAVNFYSDTLAGGTNPDKLDENGFAVVRNSSKFYYTYADMTAREGNNFALIDAKAGEEGANKRAWFASTATNPNLKLKKGTTYVLSFWAANINNYGEMDNAARFVFRIRNNTTGRYTDSRVLDLSKNEFRNNLWHQCSQIFTADEDCDDVTISVVNLNNRPLTIGNDFGLDDIQFHPISSVSLIVKSYQEFQVYAHEPKVDAFTALVVPIDCDGAPNYTVKMHVEYQNPDGDLTIHDKTTDTYYTYTLPPVNYDTKAVLDTPIVVSGLVPANHEWEAYFQNWPTAKRTFTTTAPTIPTSDTLNFYYTPVVCGMIKTAVNFDLAYTNQQGNLTFWVDDLSPQIALYSIAQTTPDTLRALSFPSVPADGRDDHVLHVSFDGPNSCIKSYPLATAPYTPTITSVVLSGVPEEVQCSVTEYDVTIDVTTPYDATGRQIVLTYTDIGPVSDTIIATGTSTRVVRTFHNINGMVQTIMAAYAATPGCVVMSDAFYPPTRLSCERMDTTLCEGQTLTWKGNVYPTTPYLGIDTFTVALDTLILTINPVPALTLGTVDRVCDDATDIHIPFTITRGNPDTYDVEVGGTHYVGTAVGSNIVFTPSTMIPGDYTATVTVSQAGSPCETVVSATYSIALSGHMYSKWTDLLFIDNSSHSYVAYQWYANGAELSGETRQYLYLPDTGMPGTYYCRLTTAAGDILYTCAQAFSDVPASRNENDGPAASAPARLYDMMGRPLQSQPAEGFYILVEEVNGQQQTRKIIVHE